MDKEEWLLRLVFVLAVLSLLVGLFTYPAVREFIEGPYCIESPTRVGR